MKVNLVDKDRRSVATADKQSGVLQVADVQLWWPYLMHENPAYLYSLEVRSLYGRRTSVRRETTKDTIKDLLTFF